MTNPDGSKEQPARRQPIRFDFPPGATAEEMVAALRQLPGLPPAPAEAADEERGVSMDRNQELDKYFLDQVARYRQETGDRNPTPKKVLRWLKNQGPLTLPPAAMEEYLAERLTAALRGDPAFICIRTVLLSGEETELWAWRQDTSPEFLAEAERQARDDWQGDCLAHERFAKET